jgi:hypothetical protein
MHRFKRTCSFIASLVLGCVLATPAIAGGGLGSEWKPVDPSRLADMRGGFVGPAGFTVSFGIERVVSINGEIVASTSLRIPDIARITAEQAQMLAALRDSQVVQVDGGTIVSGGTAGLLIQNAADGQTISARTSLDVSLNTLQLYRDNQLNAAITSAVIGTGPGL